MNANNDVPLRKFRSAHVNSCFRHHNSPTIWALNKSSERNISVRRTLGLLEEPVGETSTSPDNKGDPRLAHGKDVCAVHSEALLRGKVLLLLAPSDGEWMRSP